MFSKIHVKDESSHYDWININCDDEESVRILREEFEINQEILSYALDKDEHAHLEYQEESDAFFLIYNVPYQEKVDNHYETEPMTFIKKDDYLLTITSDKTEYIAERMKQFLNSNPETSLFNFMFHSLFFIADSYFPLIQEVNAERRVVSNRLREKTTNKNILSLSDLETGLVYLVMASKQNSVLLKQLKIHSIYRSLTESEKEQLDDALIEAKQVVEMTQLASEILQQLSGTYNNLLNNNLNDTMKILTVLSILLAVPTIVSGFFGMNMPLPFAHSNLGWVFSLLIAVFIWLVLAFLLRRRIR